MVDFQGAYDISLAKMLKPMDNDIEDQCNPEVPEIQYEFQETNCDVLYESVSQEDCDNRKRVLTQYEKARIKYLGVTDFQNSRKTCSRSSIMK